VKIGLVCPYNLSRGGAVQEIVRDMYNELTARGHEVRIIAPRPPKSRKLGDAVVDTTGLIYVGDGVDVISPGMKTVPTFSVSRDAVEIDQMLAREKFDVLHFHEPWVPMIGRQILLRSNAVNIATAHATLPGTRVSGAIAATFTPYALGLLKYIDEFTAVSSAASAYISSITDKPIKIIPNGIDLTRYKWKAHPLPVDGPKTILYLGRLEARKGAKYLLRAYALLEEKDPNIRLVLAGAGPDANKLQTLAKSLELKNVEFLGFVSDEDKKRLLAESDLLCTPALYGESFGIVLLEAMASGLVTVAGDNPGYASVMKDVGQLSLVNPKYLTELAARLDLLLNNETLRKAWQTWARGYVKQFSYTNVIDMYEQCYIEALSKHKGSVK